MSTCIIQEITSACIIIGWKLIYINAMGKMDRGLETDGPYGQTVIKMNKNMAEVKEIRSC